MTEEVTEKTISSEDTTKTASKSRSGLWIGIIVLLIVVLIAGAGFYIYQQLRSQGDDINKEDKRSLAVENQISGFQAQLAAMQTQLTEATGTISNADARFEEKLFARSKTNEEKIDATRKELGTAIQQIQRQLGKTRGDWLLADAEYLLSVAGQRLHLMGDIETTREALEAADQRLRESGDVGAFKVREEVAKELAALRAVPAIDLVGMYSSLQSLSARVNKLTLFLPYQGKPVVKSSEHEKHNAPSETSSDLLNAALKQFDGYVTVRHTEQPIKAILTAEEAQFIRQQLSLKLEMIKLALVQKNQTLYQASLADALAWLDNNFNKNAETQNFIKELKQLNTVKLNAQMPDISLSLKMLRDITKLRIEADKALPPTVLESNSAATPKVEDVKPIVVEEKRPAKQPANETNIKSEAAITTEKPVDKNPAATTSENSTEADKPNDKPSTLDSKKANESSLPETSTVKPDLKKAVEVTTPDKASTKSEPATKKAEPNPKPTVVKPIVVH